MNQYLIDFLEQAKNRYANELPAARAAEDEVTTAYNCGALVAIKEVLDYVVYNYGNNPD
jgi:hypothetical protein